MIVILRCCRQVWFGSKPVLDIRLGPLGGTFSPHMSTSSLIPSDISRTTAPLLLGALFNCFLYGVLVVQVYSYHQYFPRDRGHNKILVHAIFIIETAQTLLSGADSSYWFVSGFGNFGRLRRSFLTPVDGPILNLFVSITVRSVFCHRIWCIKKSMSWWCCIIGALSLIQCIGNLADGILVRVR
ncbi:hypothetical protein EDB89DRAFT_334799 [Lactarius sanguifluus]|nr:hypothetical protein EDB89DRAFT_334799 [Lactarius sanguifluus]